MRQLILLGLSTIPATMAHAKDLTKTFPAAEIHRVEISNGIGSVDLVVTSDQLATVTASQGDFGPECTLIIEKVGDTLHAGVEQGGFFAKSRCDADFTLKVPREVALELKNGSGSLRASGTKGPVAFKSGSGSISIEGEFTSLTGTSGSGEVKVSGLLGDADIKSGSGEITLTYVRKPTSGSLNVKTGSGNAIVLLPPGSQIKTDFRSGSGRLKNEFGDTDNAPFSVSVKMGSGDLTLKSL